MLRLLWNQDINFLFRNSTPSPMLCNVLPF